MASANTSTWDVREAVRWAVKHVQWAEAQSRGGSLMVNGSPWLAMERLRNEGCFVDGGRGGSGYEPRTVDVEPSAAAVVEMIRRIEPVIVDLIDPDNRAAMLGPYIDWVEDFSNRDVISVGTTVNVVPLLLGGREPDWVPSIGLGRVLKPKARHDRDVVVLGKVWANRRFGAGACCPLQPAISLSSVMIDRAHYIEWVNALHEIAAAHPVVHGKQVSVVDVDPTPWVPERPILQAA
ncbi:MAG: hypothetical protein AAF619_13135 [Pseudomonadota bacterium]